MTHGGGTVAGESPDRAEQQGSSEGKTTAAPPTVASSGTPASTVSAPDRVDQPTAVFKTLAPRTPEDDAEKPADEPAADPRGEGDRLKQAVAAWVATAAPEKAEDAGDDAAEGEDADDVADDAVDGPADAGAEHEAPESSAGAEEPAAGPEKPSAASEAGRDAVEAPKAAEASWFAAKKPAEPETPKAETPKTDAPKADAPKTETAEPEAVAPKPRAGEPVDQPTTMFRAVRPPAGPAVDQPTTALKLPRDAAGRDTAGRDTAGRDTAGRDAAGRDSAGRDSDSERTSTFVPLRPDIPAERKTPSATTPAPAAEKPAAAAPAAAQAPRPTPAKAAVPSPASASAPAPAPVLGEPERTRQQPLPPLPPLDLLAELTNTPPPPPNAWRTTLRRVRIWTPLVLLLLIVFAIVQMVRPLPAPALKLSGAASYTFEGGPLQMPWPNEGQGAVEVEGVGSMGTWGAQKPAPIASVTKTMTAYVILRDHPIKGKAEGPEITVDKKAADQAKAVHESTAPVKEGQTYTEKELLQLLMIPSANNVARLLARWDAGSEQAFVDKMNAAAKELGMTQSRYTDPSGLLDSTVSTPRDQLKLAKAVMRFDVFREIVDMPNATIEGVGYIENNNSRLLLKDGVTGIKTGSSTPAGGNLLWSANTIVDGEVRRILGIVMGAQNAERLNDKLELSLDYSYELIKKAQDDVTSATVVKKGQVVGYIDDGLGGRTPVVATKELKAVGWPGLKVRLALTDGGKAVPHSGKAGDVVGTVSIGTGTGKVSAPVALETDLVEPGFDKKLTRVG
ncbi:serine hydrolase [Streptomyces sp. NPDC093105]|uniref:D-alanyl-D-alanine carboxypeptidase n=1 Tax=Streptomyces sp. NPDC093105 TaxID=3366029 RepID=UPI0038142E0D